MLKISLLGEWLFWIKVGYLSPPRGIISFIIDATLRKDSENVSSALVSGYFWYDSPYVLDLFLEAQEEGSSVEREG